MRAVVYFSCALNDSFTRTLAVWKKKLSGETGTGGERKETGWELGGETGIRPGEAGTGWARRLGLEFNFALGNMEIVQ